MDGAQHICQAWGACHPYKVVGEPREFTCEECVEGMEWVQAYMTDPLWVAEYTLYLEQNYCVHDDPQQDQRCVGMVQQHFPPMHEVAMTTFDPQRVCDTEFQVCGATHPPTDRPHSTHPHPTGPTHGPTDHPHSTHPHPTRPPM